MLVRPSVPALIAAAIWRLGADIENVQIPRQTRLAACAAVQF